MEYEPNDLIKHIDWLKKTNEELRTSDGKKVDVFEFKYSNDDEIMSAWAKHFRQHYCLDSDIGSLCNGTPYSHKQYLEELKFPDKSIPPGPSIRAGDFGEILVADYLQFRLGYWVPRMRYIDKAIRNESTKGSDVIGIKFFNETIESPKDILVVYEAKAQFSRNEAGESRLQIAINDSSKDQVRKAESLNWMKQRYIHFRNDVAAKKIERFQNPEDHPYKEISGAVALISSQFYDPVAISTSTTHAHPNSENLQLVIIHGDSLMDLVHELYRRAADEA
jgi:hypothetical protein